MKVNQRTAPPATATSPGAAMPSQLRIAVRWRVARSKTRTALAHPPDRGVHASLPSAKVIVVTSSASLMTVSVDGGRGAVPLLPMVAEPPNASDGDQKQEKPTRQSHTAEPPRTDGCNAGAGLRSS